MVAETATVLFTDLVGSTELRQQIGEEAADELDRVHLDLLSETIEGSGGTVVKSVGDGAMATFTAAADAVNAAVAIQQAAEGHSRRNPDQPLSIRVGVSCGDVTERDGDYHGAAVIEAARLCDAAQGGQILVADLVRMLTRGRGGHTFESMGALELKGLDDPVPACSVSWERFAVEDGAVLTFPHLLAPPTAVAYTGRLALLADLHKHWDLVRGGEGSRLTLLVGEPGVGKTRTASELARTAHEDGTPVLYGRCDEELALSYQPFVEALDWQTSHGPDLPLGRFAGDLRRLVPEVGDRVPDLPPAMSADARAEEHRILEAVASWLVTASRDRGVVLVVDDLHWATRPTLQMLVHMVRAATADPDARLFVIGTYRDTDVDRTHPLSSMLGELRRLAGFERIPVDPLTESEVLELVEAAAGHGLDDATRELARRAYLETEGNPFFVGEVLRHFIEVGAVRFDDGRWTVTSLDDVDVPEGVRDVIGRRLDRLSDAADQVLTAAAIVGREFGLDVVANVAGLDIDDVVDVLDQALRARLVEEIGPDRFRFQHALTRQTLVEEVSATRRRRLHRRVVAALERLRPTDFAALSHHAVEGGPVGGDLSGALHYTLQAGEHALSARAPADAIDYFQRVLELVEDAVDVGPAVVLRARCGLGQAQADLGDPAHTQTLQEVTRDALAADEVDLAVRATVANARVIMSVVGGVDEPRISQLESVLDRLGDDPRPERALLVAQLASELAGTGATAERRTALAWQALDLLPDDADPSLATRTWIAAGNALAGTKNLPQIKDFPGSYVKLADRSGDPDLRAIARFQAGWFALLTGDIARARELITTGGAIAEDEGSPIARWQAGCFLAQVAAWDGDLDRCRTIAREALELGTANGEPDAMGWWAAIEGAVRWAEDDSEDLVDVSAVLVDQFPDAPTYAVFRAAILASTGRHGQCRQLVAHRGLTDPGLADGDMLGTLIQHFQVEALWRVGDREALAHLLPALEAHLDTTWSCSGLWVFTPMHLVRALCLQAAGDHEAAAHHAITAWEAVLSARLRVCIPPVAAHVVRILADGRPASVDRAREVAEAGLEEARAMGMSRRIAEFEGLLAQINGRAGPESG